MAFGGETVAIYRGELFVIRGLAYPVDAIDENGQPLYPRPDDPNDLWRPRYMYSNVFDSNPLAEERFELSRQVGFRNDPNGGRFEIVGAHRGRWIGRVTAKPPKPPQPGSTAAK